MTMALSTHNRPAHWAPTVTDLDPQPRMHRRGEEPARGAVSVSAGTEFANPFAISGGTEDQDHAAMLEYAVWLAGQPDRIAQTRELSGHDLSCTCALGD